MSSPKSQTQNESSPLYLKLRKKQRLPRLDSPSSQIEQVLSKKVGGDNLLYYEIKWRDSIFPTWEPLEKLNPFKETIDRFEKNNAKRENKDKILLEADEKPIKRLKQRPGNIPLKIEYSEGKFEFGDKAKDIILCKFEKNEKSNEKEILCLVEWAARNNGSVPLCSMVNSKELRSRDPALLIDFYERRIVFKTIPISIARTEELYQYYFKEKK